ncbi:hypothetical protein [Haloglycomyces albus]|uniref:hypothetical protein n=1 Tax=Haloglycomyces albus TaxID=526067 RepID=UPI00046D5197|nr:hypothetical protein [Haloglycomyces albus]
MTEKPWPPCDLCGRPYDPTFMTGLPCRVFSRTDEVRPGCPPQQEDRDQLMKTVIEREGSRSSGCAVLVLAFAAIPIAVLVLVGATTIWWA